jgi:outer membrane protein TolC
MKNLKYGIFLLLFAGTISNAQAQKEQIVPLDSAFALAERNSTYLKITKSATQTSGQAVKVAKNQKLPSIELGVSAMYLGDGTISDRDFSNSITAPIPDFGNNFSIEASYVVFAGGAISNTIEKSRLEAQVAELEHAKNAQNIRFLVAGQYLDLYKLYNQKKVFAKNIDQANEVVRQVKAKLEQGMALGNDLTRYELMLQNLKLAVIEIKNNISIINKHLQITLGLPEDVIILPDSSVQNHAAVITPSENDYMSKALTNRQDIRMQALKQELAGKNVQLSKANLYPSIAIIGGDHLDGPITIEVPPIDKNFNYWFVGVALKYDLASLYKSKDKTRLAKLAYNTATHAYQAEIEQTKTAMHAAQTKYKESFEKLHTFEKSYQLASENYSVINKRYLNDLVLITEMLDASNMKLKAELQVVNARLDVVFCYFKLMREMGSL